MRSLIIYDSWYGDTRRVAEEIARGIAVVSGVDPGVVEVDLAGLGRIGELDLLVLGTPNHFGGPTRKVRHLARSLARVGPFTAALAVFDTCFAEESGKASAKLAEMLATATGTPLGPERPRSFVVGAAHGPLPTGELVRAREFGAGLARTVPPRPIRLAA
ncbi:MAG: hypothetical protein L3J91_04960 [Thermoplasmata archaeon]|nr:hypothetical protein [Thermoplasmata archaeon]